MKKSILFTALIALGAISGYFYFNGNSSDDVQASNETIAKKKKLPKATRIAEAIEWRNNLVKNLETGEVNSADLIAAIEKADELKAGAQNKSGVLNLSWDNLGPDNQGGRTRAVLFDKDDPNLLYIGGVAGGLYKSTNLGNDWAPIDSYSGSSIIGSISQGTDGSIYVGTGEGLSQPGGTPVNSGQYGNGIWFSRDAGNNWEQITATSTGAGVNPSNVFGLINDLESNPVNSDVLLAATGNGLYVSDNASSGAGAISFTQAPGPSGSGQAIEISADGSFAMAVFGGNVWRSSSVIDNFKSGWTGVIGVPGGGRGDVVIAPSNSNYVYVSKNASNACLQGIYRSMDGGVSFTQIVNGGTPFELDPFNQPTSDFGDCQGQGWYDHTLEVNPVDENKIYLGGITLYAWGAGTGGIKRVDVIDTEGGDHFDPRYIHADKHEIVFSPHDPTGNTMIIGNDGGVVISENANSGFPDNINFRTINKNFNTLQCYGMGAGKYGEVMCGTQDNGSQYIDYQGSSIQAAIEVSGGDGGFAEISNFDPNILFSTTYFANIFRSINRGETRNDFVDDNIDGGSCGHAHCNNNSACGEGDGFFVTPFHLVETSQRNNPPMTAFVYARDEVLLLSTGDTVIVKDTIPVGPVMAQSSVSAVQFPQVLTSPLLPGDTMPFPDPFDAKYFVTTSCGIWMCRNPLEVAEQADFYRFTQSNGARNYDHSTDGDNLYTVMGDSRLIIYTGINSLVLPEGGCDSETSACVTGYGTVQVNVGSNLSLYGVAVDKNDPNTVLVTSAGFGSNSKVYRIENALSGSPTIVSLQPNDNTLPFMPLYDCVIDLYDSDRYVIGTELGIWTSDDAGVTWSEDNDGFGARLPVFSLRQEYMNKDWGVDGNFDESCVALYAGTHGRGMYSANMAPASCDMVRGQFPKDDSPIVDVIQDINEVTLYPNPVADVAELVFDLNRNNTVTVKIVDIAGRLVFSQSYPGMKAGMNKIQVNASDLTTGNYIAILNTSSSTSAVKFIKK